MSSHHIIRDEQEPALLFLDPEATTFELLGQLLEWSPIVMATETSISKLLEWQIKVDVIFYTSETEATIEAIAAEQYPVKIIEVSPAVSVFESAVSYLAARKQTALNIVADTDSSIKAISAMQLPEASVVIFDTTYKAYLVKSGIFSKWVPQNASFKIDTGAEVLETSNLLENKSGNGRTYLSLEDGFVRIKCSTAFWIQEELL